MNVALNVALQQQHDRYAAQVGGYSNPDSPEPKRLYAGVYNKELLTKNGKIIVCTKDSWQSYFKYAKLVLVPSECKGYAIING